MPDRGQRASNPEARAIHFASDVLLPVGMIQPRARGLRVTFESVRRLADAFMMSLTSTAIRLVEHGGPSSMFVCNSPQKSEWFAASPGVSGRLWPLVRPDQGSIA